MKRVLQEGRTAQVPPPLEVGADKPSHAYNLPVATAEALAARGVVFPVSGDATTLITKDWTARLGEPPC